MAGTTIQIRRGLSTTWSSLDPLLESGEFGLETDTRKIKIGDGETLWNDLEYCVGQAGNLILGLGDANTIESTEGDITLAPAGGGDVVVNSDLVVSGDVYSQTSKRLATEEYVDAVKQGLDVKMSVRVATKENISLSGLGTIDGVTLASGDRVLVKNQTDARQNGIYVVSAGSWSRSSDANSDSEVTSGLFTFVEEGDSNANSGWVLTTPRPITLGVTNLSFSQFSGAGQITAGAGLTKEGNVLNIGTANSQRIVVNPDSIDLATTGVTSGEYAVVTVDDYGRVTAGSNILDGGTP